MEIGSITNSYQTLEAKSNSQKDYGSSFSSFAELMRVNSVSSINQTKETKSINTSSNIEKTQKDYSGYTTFKELKDIPYEEAKENYEAIEKRALELELNIEVKVLRKEQKD